ERLEAERDPIDTDLAQAFEPKPLGIALDRDLLRRPADRVDHPPNLLRREEGRRAATEVERPRAGVGGPDLAADLLDETIVQRPVRFDQDECAVRAALPAKR